MKYLDSHLIANHIEVEDVLPYKIHDSLCLRKPDKEELDSIKEYLRLSSRGIFPENYMPYEFHLEFNEEGKSSGTRIEDSKEWKYYVLSDDRGGNLCHKIERALFIMRPNIELSARVSKWVPETDKEEGTTARGFSGNWNVISRYHDVMNASLTPSVKIPKAFFKKAWDYANTIEDVSEHYPLLGK